MKLKTKFAVMAFVLGMLGMIGVAGAADKNDPTGTWVYETTRKGKDGKDTTTKTTLKLALKDGKLTGTVSSGFGGKAGKDTAIEEGKFEKGELSFNVVRTFGDNKITSKYAAKYDGETIKGTITTDFNGKENKSEFEAKPAKEEKKKD